MFLLQFLFLVAVPVNSQLSVVGIGRLCPEYFRPTNLPDLGCRWEFVADRNGCPSYQKICHGQGQDIRREPPITQLDSICLLRPSPGDLSCKNKMTRYYYRRGQGCLRFLYSGCGGNDNNFRSQSECESRCAAAESDRRRRQGLSLIGPTSFDRCTPNLCPHCNDCIINKFGQTKCVPKFDCCTGGDSVVNCQSQPCADRDSECPAAAHCLALFCGGCTAKYFDDAWNPITDCSANRRTWGNNNIRRRPDIVPSYCDRTIAPIPPAGCWIDTSTDNRGCPQNNIVCPDDPTDPRCLLALDKGFKRANVAATLRFYYDQSGKSCEQFYFNGYPPNNANNFASRGECNNVCRNRRRRSRAGGVVESHPGYCPVYPVQCVGTRIGQCVDDRDCTFGRKCCTTRTGSCTRECVLPTREKQGICPNRYPGHSARCANDCRNDEDCAGSEKCCATNCGRTCQIVPLPIG